MQMRQRFAHRKCRLVQVELALKHDGQNICRAAWLFKTRLHHLGQSVAVVVMQLRDARVQAAKWFAVRWQR